MKKKPTTKKAKPKGLTVSKLKRAKAKLSKQIPDHPQPLWAVVSIVVDRMTVFGLATDQRVYRWNPRSALWILHKEGLNHPF
jgi:hypothetical protein